MTARASMNDCTNVNSTASNVLFARLLAVAVASWAPFVCVCGAVQPCKMIGRELAVTTQKVTGVVKGGASPAAPVRRFGKSRLD